MPAVFEGELTLSSLLEWAARTYPNQVLTTFHERHQTYREFQVQSQELAASLVRLGVREGDHVALLMENCPEWMALFFAVARLGAVLVPINIHLKASELQYLLHQADVAVLITDARGPNRNYQAMLQEISPELATSGSELHLPSLPRLRRVVLRHAEAPNWALSWAEFVQVGQGHSTADAARPDQTVLIQYTSGSTAFPKGVMITQAQLIRDGQCVREQMQFSPRDRYLVPCPMFHGAGFLMGYLAPMAGGASVVLMERFEPGAALRLIEQFRCTAVAGLDAFYLMMLGHAHLRNFDLRSLERAWLSGNEVRRRVHEEMGVPTVFGLYGLSEATANIMFTTPWNGEDQIVAGFPHSGIEVQIQDPETRRPQPHGLPGEICIRGWCVTSGYYNMPEETAKAFDAAGWFHTGDLGRILPDGRFTFEGRIKDVIKVGGENVSAAEVEDVLLKHPAIKAAAVVAAPDPRLVEVPVAFVEVRPGATVTADDLAAFCRSTLSGLKVPRSCYFLSESEWPLTGSGKLLKRELQARLPQLQALRP